MEALLFLIAIAAVVGLLVVPAVRRRRAPATAGGLPARITDPDRYGFVPPERLDVRLPGPDPELIEALEETQRTQDWQPVARLLALTDDWELRWQRVQSLAGAASVELARSRTSRAPARDGSGAPAGASGPSLSKEPSPGRAEGAAGGTHPEGAPEGARWLRDWRSSSPRDVGCAQVYAQFLVWQALGGTGSADRRIILEEAREIAREAVRLAPADPTGHITDLFAARALGVRRSDFEALWQEVRRRAPHHMGAHLVALPYWSAKGHGSREDAYAFARQAAGEAPQGSLLPALPLFAVYDHLPEANMVRGLYRSAVVEQAIDGAGYALHHAPGDHPVAPHVRHLLLCFLVRAERYAEALEQVRAVDGYVGALPWVDGADPAAEYAAYRALAVAGHEGPGGGAAAPPPAH
ncbi:hypothetical protein F0L17_16875 [Streptomyces sp. TRM43335]|uniref:DUF4034 domain-containing protein n=1 Tax=Streptomyces taklimakanensis TaxID=2569853 RepID=A0A6G2BEX7_9ACTN|nr:hypothetical protein [Streptomyces taklimakanensis]MTE20754.1 hypothetical protein [Streptomyces taklimakanensis]